MLIHFGMHHDGMDPHALRSSAGVARLGPRGLLNALEVELGLPPVLAHPVDRMMAYRECLMRCDDLARFYHRSFSVDPINVARTLMDWREVWFEAGWTGDFDANAPARLADMAAVERAAGGIVPPGQAQRVRRVQAALPKRRTQIERIVLHDDPEHLPWCWRELVSTIGFDIADGVAPRPEAAAGTDLAALQAALLASRNQPEGTPLHRRRLAGDGSIVVLRSASRDISARAVAEILTVAGQQRGSVLLAERDGIVVDNALERAGLPRCGFQHYSRFRAVAQVLKLCLGLLWDPANPHTLLQFLIHPLGPVPEFIRRELARAISREPGIGGREWQEATARLVATVRARRGATEDDADRVRDTITTWFLGQRYDPVAGAPIAALIEQTTRCTAWLTRRVNAATETSERALFTGALGQAAALTNALARVEESGRARAPKIELDRLLDESASEQPDPELFGQAHHVRGATHPATLTETVAQTIWWDMTGHTLDLSYPWSRPELDHLRDAGLALAGVDERLRHANDCNLRPVLNCRGRLILVVHDNDTRKHALWTEITSLVDNLTDVNLDTTLQRGDVSALTNLGVPTRPLVHAPLPQKRRWWELPEGSALPARDRESYTSLNKLFFHPHEWVLQYEARLHPGRAQDLADGNLLYGSLAHTLFETFFSTQQNWLDLTPEHIQSWLDDAVPRLMRASGAVLLETGRGFERQHVATTLASSLHRLIAHLRAGGVVSVAPERHEEAPLLTSAEAGDGGALLGGDIDLLLTTGTGRELVMDAKWGSERFHQRNMAENAHLQLATYSYLRKRATGANTWPYPSYFVISTGNVVAPDSTVFPDAIVASAEGKSAARTLPALWAKCEQTYLWRRRQLDRRQIEVPVDGTEPTPRSTAPASAFDTDRDANPFDEFATLVGWDSFS